MEMSQLKPARASEDVHIMANESDSSTCPMDLYNGTLSFFFNISIFFKSKRTALADFFVLGCLFENCGSVRGNDLKQQRFIVFIHDRMFCPDMVVGFMVTLCCCVNLILQRH